MNKRNIQPVSFWTPNGEKQASKIKLFNFHDYNFNQEDTSRVNWNLLEVVTIDEVESFNVLDSGSVLIPYAIVETWGEDDEPIFDYVITTLGLTKI